MPDLPVPQFANQSLNGVASVSAVRDCACLTGVGPATVSLATCHRKLAASQSCGYRIQLILVEVSEGFCVEGKFLPLIHADLLLQLDLSCWIARKPNVI